MIETKQFCDDCRALKACSPLVLNITNYVAMSLSANALLSFGASPLMSSCLEEMDELVARCDALVVNIGCLDAHQIEAMRRACEVASLLSKPWVLDPVGAGASELRTKISKELASHWNPSVIRANASEIMSLAGRQARSRGADSGEDSSAALESACELALEYCTVVSVSGPVDYITDGTNVAAISNGNPMMTRHTAMGCTATALTGAFAAVADPFDAAFDAMAVMGVAGETAALKAEGPGSLAPHFLDCLYAMSVEEFAERLRYEQSAL